MFTKRLTLLPLVFATSVFSIYNLLLKIPLKTPSAEGCAIKELESFLTIFASELNLGNSPERAYEKSLQNYRGALRAELVKIHSRILQGVPLSQALSSITRNPTLKQCSPLIFIASQLMEMDSKRAGENLAQLVLRARENRRLIEEKEHLLKSLSFKVKILTITCSASLGMLLSLLPLFPTLTNTQLFTSFTFQVHWPLSAALSLTTAVSAYYAGLAALSESPYFYPAVSLIVFWFVFLTATSFLSSFFLY